MAYIGIEVLQENFELPVSIQLARQQLRAEHHNADDALIEGYIRAAAESIEQTFDLSLLRTKFKENFTCFPTSRRLYLRKRPIFSLDAIEYIDLSGNWVSLPIVNFSFGNYLGVSYISPKTGLDWPLVYEGAPEDAKVSVVYQAGYSSCHEIPHAIRHSILLQIAHAYERREDPPMGGNLNRASYNIIHSLYNYLQIK